MGLPILRQVIKGFSLIIYEQLIKMHWVTSKWRGIGQEDGGNARVHTPEEG